LHGRVKTKHGFDERQTPRAITGHIRFSYQTVEIRHPIYPVELTPTAIITGTEGTILDVEDYTGTDGLDDLHRFRSEEGGFVEPHYIRASSFDCLYQVSIDA
jgi:hypothetical protein